VKDLATDFIKTMVNWLLSKATFEVHAQGVPDGKLWGGGDVPGVRDTYLVLDVRVGGKTVLKGCWQML
jgi:hypothetical protein